MDSVRQKVFAYGLSSNVEFCGNVRDVDKYILGSEIFAFTSLSEGFPNALLEAMSGGLACVSYDCVAGPSELIHDAESGYLVPQGNKALFATRLRELMDDAGLRRRIQEAAKEFSR